MISDILFKSPISDSWSFENSSVMNEEWGEPIDLISGLMTELDDTLDYFGLNPIFSEDEAIPLENEAEESETEMEQTIEDDAEEAEELEEESNGGEEQEQVVENEEEEPAEGEGDGSAESDGASEETAGDDAASEEATSDGTETNDTETTGDDSEPTVGASNKRNQKVNIRS